MVLQEYMTIRNHVQVEIVEKKSKFIADIFPIQTAEEALETIQLVRKQHRDARHHVFAYRIVNMEERCSDDGEPSGTAGVPILDLLRGSKLQNVLVVVTRYFGGVLLGTGGLVRAYSEAARQGILKVDKVSMFLCVQYCITIDYEYYNILQHYCKTNQLVMNHTEFSEKIITTIIVTKDKEESFLADIRDLSERKGSINVVNTGYYAQPEKNGKIF